MKRSLELDFLRCVAVLLVLFRHLAPLPSDTPEVLRSVLEAAGRMGWMGVDLFFVLSGYLISGLLFREYLQHGHIDFKQFFIRRGLKIYPSFYLLLFASVAAGIAQGWHVPWRKLLAEAFFYQNYRTGLWSHTWSLAVEEHFYLTLPWLLILLARKKNAGAANPFRALPGLFLVLAVIVFAARLLAWRSVHGDSFERDAFCHTHLFPTHLRIDSLGFGALLSYLHHFHATALVAWVRRWRGGVAGVFVIAVCPPAFWELEQTPFLYTAGFTLVYLGMGSLLLLCLVHGFPATPLFRLVAYLGAHSYSVYLWHLAFATVMHMVWRHWPHVPWWLQAATFVGGSFLTGIVMGKLVEIPVLALRDRYFPSRSKPLEALRPSEN